MKPRALLIAEKPSLKKKIDSIYTAHKADIPYELDTFAQRGHLMRLLEPKEIDPIYERWDIDTLPIIPEKEGGWQYVLTDDPDLKSRYSKIKEAYRSGKYDFIIHAGDADQEGELLVREVLQNIENTLPVKRLWTDFETEKALLNALINLRDDSEPQFENLYKAALIRQHTDYRFGMNGSIAAGTKFGITGASTGRCKAAMLDIVVTRTDEIRNFVPKTVYGVKVIYENGLEGMLFDDSRTKEQEKEEGDEKQDRTIYFDTEQEAKDFIRALSATGTVTFAKKETVKKHAPGFLNLDRVQSEAFKLGYGLEKTLSIVQELYEAGYVSYPRTDCYYLSTDVDILPILNSTTAVPGFESIRNTVSSTDIEQTMKMKLYFNNDEAKKHGHGALTPTDEKPDFNKLSREQQDIFTIIAKRTLAAFLPPLVQDKVSVITDIDGQKFRSSGKTTVSKGWTEFLATEVKERTIPAVHENDTLKVKSFQVAEKTSSCPKYFTEATLSETLSRPFAFLEDKSLKRLGEAFQIGKSSTKSVLLESLFKKGYLTHEKNNIVPTPLGEYLCRNMRATSLGKVDTTGIWEVRMEDVRQGIATFEEIDRIMQEEVIKMVNDIKNCTIVGTNPSSKNNAICTCPTPGCGGNILAGSKSYYCSNYKSGCKTTIWKQMMGATFSPKDALTLFSGKKVKKKLTSSAGKTWEQELFYDTAANKIAFAEAEKKVVPGLTCPSCGKGMSLDDKACRCSCGFTVWRTIAGKKLTESQIKKLVNEGSTEMITGFKSKAGKTFSAKIVLKDGKTTFDFR